MNTQTLIKTSGMKQFKIVIGGSGDTISVQASVAHINSYGVGAFSVVKDLTMNEDEAKALIAEHESDGFVESVPAPKPVSKTTASRSRIGYSKNWLEGGDGDADDEFFDDQYGHLLIRH